MTTLIAFSAILQLSAIYWMWRIVKNNWFSRCGALLLTMMVIYHGLTEVVNVIFPDRNFYRVLTSNREIAVWVLTVSFAIVVFVWGYFLATNTYRKEFLRNTAGGPSVLNIRALFLISVSCFLFYFSSRFDPEANYWRAGLSNQFLILSVVLSFASLLSETKGKYFFPVILSQSLCMSLLVSRLSILASLLMLLSLQGNVYPRPKARILIAAICFFVLLSVTISSARELFGREFLKETAPLQRLSSLNSGLYQSTSMWDPILDDVVYRFDGNTFGALIQSTVEQRHFAGFSSLWNNIAMTVPSFLYKNKLDRPLQDRDEEAFIVERMSLPPQYDYNPTLFGVLYSYYGIATLFFGAFVFGYFFGKIDFLARRPPTTTSVIISVAACYCVVFYEQGLTVYFLTFRGALALYVTLAALNWVSRLNGRAQP